MEKRFRALRFVSLLYKIIAVLGAVGAIAGAVFLSVTQVNQGLATWNDALPTLIGGVVGGILGGILLFGLAQLFDLLIAVEENTRATSRLLQRVGRLMQDQGRL
jgi:uncharacterized membrane protein YfcA